MLLRRSKTPQAYLVWNLQTSEGYCTLFFAKPTPQAKMEIAADVLALGSILERYQYDLLTYKTGKRDQPPRLAIPVSTLNPILNYLKDHLQEIQGIHDEDGVEIPLSDLDSEELSSILIGAGLDQIVGLVGELNTQGGLSEEIKIRFASYVRGEEVDLPHTDISWCVTQHNLHIGAEGSCPLHAPQWLKDIHQIILNERLRQAEIRSRLQQEEEILKQFGIK